jgi:hypothetical protein
MAIVSYWENELPPITEEQEARLTALALAPDDEINCSDIPEITDFSGFMTVPELEAYKAAKKKQTASV